MKKLQGMKKDFSSLENKKMNNPANIIGGRLPETNTRTTSESGPSGEPGNTGDTVLYDDGVKVATLKID
ncbi:hypothetical protein SAMN05421866_3454 [Chryseobacterium oranimense]|uniref:Uncharacterized protein n=1 Tax=Chryseobacterium oranimense TaxID=421058 RepID=A0A1M5UYI4_9FLAO|nr:hypothetical protein [Chryseobacterium oranimense]CEJ70320.1 hypothetical protein BN1195_02625 [Chryseobacterium oranimense G311]SHH68117.1 hypothetical protein SAMN05421866_3454 [Chryseobacterium oranimense]